ncbi:MAG: hypothetical protein U0R24_02880 [Solirubrobacterales bacterium]
MHARVVRFNDVDPERVAEVVARIEESDGPPPGVDAESIEMLYDESQRTAVVVVRFEDVERMEAGNEVLSSMDAGETPGSRASVDLCEIRVRRSMS